MWHSCNLIEVSHRRPVRIFTWNKCGANSCHARTWNRNSTTTRSLLRFPEKWPLMNPGDSASSLAGDSSIAIARFRPSKEFKRKQLRFEGKAQSLRASETSQAQRTWKVLNKGRAKEVMGKGHSTPCLPMNSVSSWGRPASNLHEISTKYVLTRI